MMDTHLKDAYQYYQNVTDSSADLVLQNMMINAVKSGLANYSAKTDSSAAILNNQFSKTQLQHRAAWNIGSEKAIWFLPLLHTILLMMMFAVFPIVLILATVTGGMKILKSYLVFLFSLELWPMLFSILNAAMVMYGSSKTSQFGAVASVDIDSLDQIHQDLASVAGFLMMSIPFLAKGLVSNIGEAFAGLATSLTSHMQGASMQAAGEVANASYSLGNNSFYNTTANTLSANKHDVNYTDFAGQRTVQALSGATITDTGEGETIYNSQPAISNSAIGVVSFRGLQDSLTHAKERSDQSVFSKASSFNDSVSQAGHKAYQFNDSKAHDMRLGEGASSSESFQAQQALSHAWSMAEDVAKRNGLSTEEAFAGMARHTYSAQAGFDVGKIPVVKYLGVSAGASTSHGIENSHSGTNRNSASTDFGLNAREEESFRSDLSAIESYTKSHHFDSSGTESENLLYQVGTDLRQAQSFSESLSTSLSQSERISDAQNYVSTHGEQLNHNLNQEAIHWAVENYGQEKMNYLETHPADSRTQNELEHIKQEFLDSKASLLIHENGLSNVNPQHYDRHSSDMNPQKNSLGAEFNQQAKMLKDEAVARNLGIDKVQKQALFEKTGRAVETQRQTLNLAGANKAKNVSQTVKTPVKKYSDKPERQ
ncbi:conjugal transfer protein TraG N-terminal domain-containing protein (plasmid) [Legionella sp. D16C41]|uniref:conjugal transfer protein TraG N-terminal domain-containing protein n=1 Tax=Legionella sp. D16C41 TaxID=3402688 RepID=UPI003AF6CA6D